MEQEIKLEEKLIQF